MDLTTCSDEDLLASVTSLTGSHREITARLIAHLAEVEERRLHLLRGFSSMFDFCTNELRFSEGESFRRILAARLAKRFPVVLELLAAGSVNLSTLELLREWLSDENHEELFAAVAGKTKRQVLAVIAARFPRPDRPSRIRRATVEPLAEARFSVEFTASKALCQKLELCRDLMSHANPSRDLAVVIERALDLLIADLERKRLGKTKRPQPVGMASDGGLRSVRGGNSGKPAGAPARNPSRVTTSIRREVFERDGLRCTYVSESGSRCEARAFLELDHAIPKALGGSNDAENLRVLCRSHNQLSAEQAFGREWIERRRHFRQQKSTSARKEPTSARSVEFLDHGRSTPNAATFEKVRCALRGLGFRDAEARRAISAVIAAREPNEPIGLERALREALHAATAA